MFLDLNAGGRGNDAVCMSCDRRIAPGDLIIRIRFEDGDEYHLDRLNGLYHAACAAPFQTVIRAIDSIRGTRF